MAHVLVTGGTGFVGRELVAQLAQRGDNITCLSRSQPPNSAKWVEGDFVQADQLESLTEGLDIDVIYHVASLANDTGNPQEMIQVNVTGITNMLELARRREVQRFVLSSSISAYEWYPATKFRSPLETPVTEDHPCRPQDMYSSTKRMQEILADTFYRQYGVPTTVLRVTAVVGPDGRGGGKMWREFAEQMKAGGRIQLPMLAPDEKSHFVDLRDVAQMHIVAAEHPNAVGEVFNCCATRATRGSEFAGMVEQLVPGCDAAFGFPWSMAQGAEIEFSMEKIKSLLDFEPQYTLRDALQNIHDWVEAGGLEST